MSAAFTCPSCGAPIQTDGHAATVRCSFCSQTIIVPDALRAPTAARRGDPGALVPDQAQGLVQVIQQLRRGNRDEAIRLYGALFGVGRESAARAVAAIEAGQPVTLTSVGGAQPVTSATVTVGPQTRAAAGRGAGWLAGCLVGIVGVAVMVGIVATALGLFSAQRSFGSPVQVAVTLPPEAEGAIATASALAGPAPVSGPLTIAQRVGAPGIGAGQFDDARSVAVDRAGNLYVVEYGGGRVQRFAPDGAFAGQWMVDDEFPVRAMTANRAGEILIVQRGAITRYDGLTGAALGTIGDPAQRYDDVAPLLDGGVVAITQGMPEALERWDASGQLVLRVEGIVSGQTGQSATTLQIAADGDENVYIASGRDETIFHFDREGRFLNRIGSSGMEPGQFRALSGVGVDGQGRLYATDFHGVQLFTRDGRYLGVVDPETPVDDLFVTDDDSVWVAGRSVIYRIVASDE